MEQSDVGSRIRQLRKQKSMTQAQLAKVAKVSAAAVTQWESGLQIPKSESLTLVAQCFGVSPSWLLTGIQPTTQVINIESWDSSTPLDSDEVEIPFYKDFNLACGSGAMGEALESETRRLRMSKFTLKTMGIETRNACAMTAFGDSMNPIINDKDTIYVDRGRKTIKDGKVFAICHGGLFKVKYLYNLPNGGVRIVSANSTEFPEERLTAQEIIEQDFIIEGWVFSYQALMIW